MEYKEEIREDPEIKSSQWSKDTILNLTVKNTII